jgi:hypothetical protein
MCFVLLHLNQDRHQLVKCRFVLSPTSQLRTDLGQNLRVVLKPEHERVEFLVGVLNYIVSRLLHLNQRVPNRQQKLLNFVSVLSYCLF